MEATQMHSLCPVQVWATGWARPGAPWTGEAENSEEMINEQRRHKDKLLLLFFFFFLHITHTANLTYGWNDQTDFSLALFHFIFLRHKIDRDIISATVLPQGCVAIQTRSRIKKPVIWALAENTNVKMIDLLWTFSTLCPSLYILL